MEIIKKVKWVGKSGFNRQMAPEISKICNKFKCRIMFENKTLGASGNNVLLLKTLNVLPGAQLTMIFEGEDAKYAWTAIRDLFIHKAGVTEEQFE